MKSPTELFMEAEQFLCLNGFGEEIIWCENRPPFEKMDQRAFLCEYAFVVYNSGMKYSVIHGKWVLLTDAFHLFVPHMIVSFEKEVREKVLTIFGHKQKVEAVIIVAKKIVKEGFEHIRSLIIENPLKYLESLPFIGPVTKYHLARNIGFDFVKPDRHLVRLAEKYNMSPEELCNQIHKETRRRLGVIDVVLWRFMEQHGQQKLTQTAQKSQG